MAKTTVIDEEGYFVLNNGVRLTDPAVGLSMLKSLSMDEYGVIHLDHEGEDILVEAFDKPFVARQVHFVKSVLSVQMPYEHICEVDMDSLCLDEWDRFHGKTKTGMPFVLSRPAQAELFNLADDFTDDSLRLGNHTVTTPPYYLSAGEVSRESFWSERYQENPSPGWNLDKPHPEIKSTLQQLKINKMRILVPGCGYGHDAALLAQQGHIVTAVDISPDALSEARRLYGHVEGLSFIEGDVFELGSEYHSSFDLIFEHTCYCAISPERRDELILCWKKYLAETGHVLGIFFVVPKRTGPYFGGSEWELREKLKKKFQFLYWTRLQHSPGWRKGAELMVYCQLRS